MQLKSVLLTAAGLSALATAALADPTPLEEVVITADPLGRSGAQVASNVAVLTGEELAQRRESTLGETLKSIPGVNSDTFGGGASRPIIRGQTSPRVQVLSDGGVLMDASQVSPDHAITGDPLLIDGVEILRGPTALLYGGGAIGGAVNLIDRKIPTYVPADGGEGVGEVRLGSADGERSGAVGITAGKGNFAARIEAAARRTRDYEVPGWDENRVDGTFNRTFAATLGLSWIGEKGYLGAAYTEQRSEYGVPGHSHEYESCHPHGSSLHCGGHDHGEDDHDHDHEHEEDHAGPFVDLISRRLDVRGELRNPMTGIERIRIRGGRTDYKHHEKESAIPATTFTNDGYDGRIEVQHAPIGGLRGVIGVQASRSDFAAVGQEGFLRPSRTDSAAVFLLEEYQLGAVRFEGAVRQEWQDARAEGRGESSHDPFSVSGAATWSFLPGYSASVSLARSQRAPTVQELYARGIHLATNTYDLGTATLSKETATSLELTLRKTRGATTFSASAYRYDYDGYIYANTLDQFEEFRLIRYAQDDARFTGVEGQIRHAFTPAISASVFGDYVRAKVDAGDDLPRIPAGRLGVRADYHKGPWAVDAEYVRTFDQERIAAFETETNGYDMLNATVAYDVRLGGFDNQIFLRGTNLLDELALNHASYLTRVAPLRGRNVVVGVRTRF
jgi:iron complex outermembrane receptor protein